MSLILGSHVSFTKSEQLLGSVKEAISYNADTFMIYTGPTQSTMRYDIDDNLSYQAYQLMIENNINSNNVIVHAPYIVNLGDNVEKDRYKFYIDFITKELERVKLLGFNKLVLHPGNAVRNSREDAINSIAFALNTAFKSIDGVTVLLEYMAGKGNEVGCSIHELSMIIDKIEDKSRVGVCLDTCHMNDSGIDLKTFDLFLKEFEKEIGLDKIKCLHLNDSMNQVGAHKDRHDNIGYGTIGFDKLINVAYNPVFEGIPIILETPYINRNTKDERPPYKEEIEMIRNKKFTLFK